MKERKELRMWIQMKCIRTNQQAKRASAGRSLNEGKLGDLIPAIGLNVKPSGYVSELLSTEITIRKLLISPENPTSMRPQRGIHRLGGWERP